MIVSERQMVKGISRVVAVTGGGAKSVRGVTFSAFWKANSSFFVIFNKNLLNKQEMLTPPSALWVAVKRIGRNKHAHKKEKLNKISLCNRIHLYVVFNRRKCFGWFVCLFIP